ncbi:MAG: M23 family metallopeptidase [Phototrophicaceae bacterium]
MTRKSFGVWLTTLIVSAAVALVLLGLAALAVSASRQPSTRTVMLQAATVAPLFTPAVTYEALNPTYAQSGAFGYDWIGQTAQIQTLGRYLPNDNAARDPDATPLPTPFPYPTTAPYPTDELPAIPAPNGFPRNCAPDGLPVSDVIEVTQRFNAYHPAVDLGVYEGTPVQATHSAQVIFVGWSEIGYGYAVILQSGEFVTYYSHNSQLLVTLGQWVPKGTTIAMSGNSGNSTGPHLHYETRLNDILLDPFTFATRGYRSC